MARIEQLQILEVVPSLEIGGAERLVCLLAAELPRLGAGVSVVSLYDGGSTAISAELERLGTPVYKLGKHRGPDLGVFGRLRSAIAAVQPDVIHTHLYSLRYAWRLGAGIGQPMGVHTVHSLASTEADRFGRFVRRRALRRGWRFVCCSGPVMADAVRVYGDAGFVEIPNGALGHPFDGAVRPRAQGSGIRLICVARLSRHKAPMLVLQAFAKARRLAKAELELEFVGGGPLYGELQQEVQRLGLAGCVRLVGERSDVAERLANADVFVLGSRFEGLPMAVIEAMFSGLPVIATRVGGVGELVDDRHSGYLVDPGDDEALAGAIVKLVDAPALRVSMGLAGRERASRYFSSAAMAQKYLAQFRIWGANSSGHE